MQGSLFFFHFVISTQLSSLPLPSLLHSSPPHCSRQGSRASTSTDVLSPVFIWLSVPTAPMSHCPSLPTLESLLELFFNQEGRPAKHLPAHWLSLSLVLNLSVNNCLNLIDYMYVFEPTSSFSQNLRCVGAIILCRIHQWQLEIKPVQMKNVGCGKTEGEMDFSEQRENSPNELVSYFLTLTWVWGAGQCF